MDRLPTQDIQIHGTAAPGFESVKALFERNMRNLAERHNQLCIYHKGELVVDLWASAVPGETFSPDSLVNIFSSGKSFEAIAIAWAMDQGLIDYNARIVDYWPEFGANGKEALTVAELMRHEAGLPAFQVSIDPDDLLTENIKQNKIGSIIEAHPQTFRKQGSTREYHAVTRGWIVNEVFRRVDPNGRTIGEFIQETLRQPLNVDVCVGVKDEELHRVTQVVPLGGKFQLWEGLKPGFAGRRMEKNIFQTAGRVMQLIPSMRQRTTKGTPPPFTGMNRIGFFNDHSVVKGETPSANTNATARGLAKVAALMSMGGTLNGVELLSQSAWQAMHDKPDSKDMGFAPSTFTQGGVAKFDRSAGKNRLERALNNGREGYYGWMGLGGSVFQWHPGQKIGFGYVPTSLNVLDLFNERAKLYQAEALKCAEQI
jgi:CubicO group peptidase (beta-lactamase class C family)